MPGIAEASIEALAVRVGKAAAELPERELRALALREREGMRYAGIADALKIREADVPSFLVAARLWVRDGIHRSPLPALSSEWCPRARELLTTVQDAEPISQENRDWLREHVGGCESCRAVRVALREATLACRAWVVAPAGKVAAATEAAPAPAPRVSAPVVAPVAPVTPPVPAAESVAPAAPKPARASTSGAPNKPRPRHTPPAAPAPKPRRRRSEAVAFGALLLLTVGVAAAISGGLGSDDTTVPASATVAPSPTATAAPTRAVAAGKTSEKRKPARPKRKAKAKPKPVATAAPTVAATPTPAATAVPVVATPKPKAQKPPAQRKPQPKPAPGGNNTTGEVDDTGSGLAQPTPAPPAGGDVVPPPGDEFCAEGDPSCE